MNYRCLCIFLCAIPVILLLFWSNQGIAEDAHPHPQIETVEAKLVRVVDGDTIVVDIPDYPEVVGKQISVRIAGCDTPELRDKRTEIRLLARLAKSYTETSLHRAQNIQLRNVRRGKYFRLVADVIADGESLSEELLRHGLAKPYSGGKRCW